MHLRIVLLLMLSRFLTANLFKDCVCVSVNVESLRTATLNSLANELAMRRLKNSASFSSTSHARSWSLRNAPSPFRLSFESRVGEPPCPSEFRPPIQ